METAIQEFKRRHAPRSEKMIPLGDSSNSKYKGQLKNGERNGYGELRNGNNLYYGHFKANLPEGEGLLIRDLNSLLWGTFKKGKIHGEGF